MLPEAVTWTNGWTIFPAGILSVLPAVPISPLSPLSPVTPLSPEGPLPPVEPLSPLSPWTPSGPLSPEGPCVPWMPLVVVFVVLLNYPESFFSVADLADSGILNSNEPPRDENWSVTTIQTFENDEIELGKGFSYEPMVSWNLPFFTFRWKFCFQIDENDLVLISVSLGFDSLMANSTSNIPSWLNGALPEIKKWWSIVIIDV